MKDYTFTIIGDNGVGKSTFINRLATGQFTNEQNDEQNINFGNDVIIHTTTNQDINFNTDGLVLMFDIHNPKSFKYLEKYLTLNKPMVLVGNKYDLKYEDVDETLSVFENRWYVKKWRELQQSNTNMKFFEISSKSNYNFEKPFNALITV